MGAEPPPEEQTQPESGGRHLGGKHYTHTQIGTVTKGSGLNILELLDGSL